LLDIFTCEVHGSVPANAISSSTQVAPQVNKQTTATQPSSAISPTSPAAQSNDSDPPPRTWQLQAAAGLQAARDVLGLGPALLQDPGFAWNFSVGLMHRGDPYSFSPDSGDMHGEHALSFAVQPNMWPSDPPKRPGAPRIHTAQISYTYTFADLATFGRIHLLNPAAVASLSFPLNPGSATPFTDPAARVIGGIGVQSTITFDIVPNYLSINLAGQAMADIDMRTGTVFSNLSGLIFVQGTFGMGPRVNPKRKSADK
jgi:hypothetical protein